MADIKYSMDIFVHGTDGFKASKTDIGSAYVALGPRATLFFQDDDPIPAIRALRDTLDAMISARVHHAAYLAFYCDVTGREVGQ